MEQVSKRRSSRRRAVEPKPSGSRPLPSVKRQKEEVAKVQKKTKRSNKKQSEAEENAVTSDKVQKEEVLIKSEPRIDEIKATVDQTAKDKDWDEGKMIEIPLDPKEELLYLDNNIGREEVVVSEVNTTVTEDIERNADYIENEDFSNTITVSIISVKAMRENKQIQTDEISMNSKTDGNTQTNEGNTPIRINTAVQTDPVTEVKNKKIQTNKKHTQFKTNTTFQMELSVEIMKDEATQFEVVKLDQEVQTDPISAKTMNTMQTQTEIVKFDKAVQTVDPTTSLQELRRPFQMKSVNYARLVDVFILFPFYQAIEVVKNEYWSMEKKRKFPTEWLQLTNPYWDQFRAAAVEEYLYNTKQFVSAYDDATVWVQEKRGVLYAIRHGYKVIIRYPDGRTGGRYQYEPLLEVQSDGPKTVPNGVPVAYIPPDCPFWHHLFVAMTFPPPDGRGYSRTVLSKFDNGHYFVLVETNGQIDVKRDGLQFRLRNHD